LGRALTWTWGIACAVSLLAAIAHLSRAGLVSDFLDNPYSVSMSEADDADANVILATGARIATNGLAFIIMIVFAWRATKNLQMSGATLKRGPGWAGRSVVGSFPSATFGSPIRSFEILGASPQEPTPTTIRRSRQSGLPPSSDSGYQS